MVKKQVLIKIQMVRFYGVFKLRGVLHTQEVVLLVQVHLLQQLVQQVIGN